MEDEPMGSPEKQSSHPANTQINEPHSKWWTRFVGYVKSQMDKRRSKTEQETPADKAARLTAKATVWMAFFTLVIVIVNLGTLWVLNKQLGEMHDGGIDTHNLAVAAGKQATWTQNLATNMQTQADRTEELADRMKDLADRTKTLAAESIIQAKAAQVSADAAQNAADTAKAAVVIGNRPWIKVTPQIVSPLTFGVLRNGGPMAMMTVKNHFENVGQSVALNIVFWEDVIPVDPDHSFRTALARQKQWCDAHRHNQANWSGSVRFPHDPWDDDSIVGPSMATIREVMKKSENDPIAKDKVAFVLVGCVSYRSSFEPQNTPNHETKFLYWLGIPVGSWGMYPYVTPNGTAEKLRLIEVPTNFSAD